MPTRDRNEFLEGEGSESEDGYVSEEEELQKGGGRSVKRRKIELDEDDFDNDDDLEEEDEEDPRTAIEQGRKHQSPINEAQEPESTEPQQEKQDQEAPPHISEAEEQEDTYELPDVSRPLIKKNLITTTKAISRSGVVYLSRIPPYMKVGKLRSLLEPYAPHGLNRIFLTPESDDARSRRIRSGGNKKKVYTDGWVEFVSKREAQAACELLNTQIIGGQKNSYYHDDIWNCVYLKGFKWQDLTREIAAENAERQNRMRAELTKTRREDRVFEGNVERAKVLEGMKKKKEAKSKDREVGEAGSIGGKEDESGNGRERARQYKQNAVVPKKKLGEQPADVKRVLSKIF